MARKSAASSKNSAKKETVLSREYIDRHLPEEEFNLRDFERFEELAIFGWRVGSALMHEAKKDPRVTAKDGPKRIEVKLTFVITPETKRNGGNCIRVGRLAAGTGGAVHVPCLDTEGRRRYPTKA
jgi:hypothetical protein